MVEMVKGNNQKPSKLNQEIKSSNLANLRESINVLLVELELLIIKAKELIQKRNKHKIMTFSFYSEHEMALQGGSRQINATFNGIKMV